MKKHLMAIYSLLGQWSDGLITDGEAVRGVMAQMYMLTMDVIKEVE